MGSRLVTHVSVDCFVPGVANWGATGFAAILVAIAVLPGAAGCSRDSSPKPNAVPTRASIKQQLFTDVTRESGIDFVHDADRKGKFLFPEITGAGCGFLDFDNDGWLDIYLVQGGVGLSASTARSKANQLYRNLGDGRFADVTAASGAGDTGYGQGLACGDFNNDGFVDIYVANVGSPSALLMNRGNGTFTDVAKLAGVDSGKWAIVPAWLDFDNDGWLDLLVTHYVDWKTADNLVGRTKSGQADYVGPRSFPAVSAILYRNNQDGTFADVTTTAGIDKAFGAAMGVLCVDFDDDDLVDIFVANDSWPNQLWKNLGDGRFQDVGLEQGCALSGTGLGQASMGTNAEDVDGDGRLDIFTTNYHDQGAILYLQEQRGLFADVSRRVGLFRPTAARTGFGACFLDLFNSGEVCVYIGNGAAVSGGEIEAPDGYAQRDMLLQWSPTTKRFTDISDRVGSAMDAAYTTRGVATGDFDNDGAVDVLISNNDGPARLLRNTAGGSKNWLMVRCLDSAGKRDVIGAKVFVTVAGATRRRDVVVNYSYASVCDPRLHFGLASKSVADEVRVRWPGGGETVRKNIASGQVLELRKPD